MSRSNTLIICACFSVFIIACSGCSTEQPSNRVKPADVPLSTSEEIVAALQDTNEFNRWHAAKRLENLWSGRTELLINALDNDNSRVRKSACTALAKIGSETALGALRKTCSDSSLGFSNRLEAAMALGSAADQTALPILQDFQILAKAKSSVSNEYAKIAISWILNPDSRIPLALLDEGSVQLRFLADDIASVFYLESPYVLSIGSQFIHEFGDRVGVRHKVPPEQYRTVFDLLQGSGLCPPKETHGSFELTNHLVIVLHDGLSICLYRNRDMFHYWAEWNCLSPRFSVCSASLAEYLDSLN